jgi:hypothetical protein
MTVSSSQPIGGRSGPARRTRLLHVAGAALLFVLLLGAAMPVAARPGSAAEAGRLRSDLARMAKLANRGLRPPALRLAQQLPAEGERLKRLREPASTTAVQTRVTLDELRQMSALRLDPHYLPALVAAGRAFLAASGQDPLTGTAVSPEYAGLEAELAGSEARLGRDAADAAKLSARVKRLGRALVRSRRRAGRLEHHIGRLRAAARRRPGDGAR